MESIARHQYPPVVWRDGVKKLRNIIHRKTLKNRPEERVRLRIIEFLLEAGWSKHRISTEEDIGEIADSKKRTDIICYSQQIKPLILIECKAENIPISSKTAQQVARYNQRVNAPYLLMTNGVQDFWYSIDIEKREVRQLSNLPDILNATTDKSETDFKYWEDRGFAGSRAATNLRRWLMATCKKLWFQNDISKIRFLDFEKAPPDLDLSHYYQILSYGNGRRLAISTLSTPYGGSRLIAILNEDSTNTAVVEVNLDLLFDGQSANTSIYSSPGVETKDIRLHWDPTPAPENGSSPHSIGDSILDLLNIRKG